MIKNKMETNWEDEYVKLTDSALRLHEMYKEKNKKYYDLKKELKVVQDIMSLEFERPYAKRYLQEKRDQMKMPNLAYPDSEMVYMDYYKLKERNDKAIKYIDEAITSDSFIKLPSGKTTDIAECIPAFKDLLEILKGKDKE